MAESTEALVICSRLSFVGCVTQICCCKALATRTKERTGCREADGFVWDLFEEQDSVLRCDELKDCRALPKQNGGRLQFWISGETALPALICKRIPAQHSLNAVN